jgi:hypothetical protein
VIQIMEKFFCELFGREEIMGINIPTVYGYTRVTVIPRTRKEQKKSHDFLAIMGLCIRCKGILSLCVVLVLVIIHMY